MTMPHPLEGSAFMNRFPPRMLSGIRFADYLFTNPTPIERCTFPARVTGIFVVLVPDPTWGPWHLQPLYFGQFRLNGESEMSVTEQILCLRVAAGKPLYVASFSLPIEQTFELSRIMRDLIDRYRPIVNRQATDESAGDIAHKFDAVEKRIYEQEAVLKVVLAALGQMSQAVPEPKRRSVGFQPNPAGSRRPASGSLQHE
jgi:hypothetical protein